MTRAAKEVERIEFAVPLRLGRGQNEREHWAVKMKRVKKERAVIHLAWPRGKTVKGPWVVKLIRMSPRGKLDDDNLVASLKAVRDQVAEELGVDDGNRGEIYFYYKYAKGPWAVKVEVERPVFMLDSSVLSGGPSIQIWNVDGKWSIPDDALKAIGGRR